MMLKTIATFRDRNTHDFFFGKRIKKWEKITKPALLKLTSDKTETGTVNGKTMKEILGDNWEDGFKDKNDETAIRNEKNKLIGKINKEDPEQKQQITDEESMEIFQELFEKDDATAKVEPVKEKAKTWTKYNNENSKLKNKEQIKKFLEENVKGGKENDFAKYLEEKLPEADKPTGKNELEKVNKFLVSQDSETVIKTIFAFKVEKDESFRTETETKMNEEKDGEKVLDETVYAKKDGKFAPEAMTRYLFEEQTGQSHQFAKKEQQKNTPTSELGHWDKNKWWYIGGGIVVLVIAGVAIFWNNLFGSSGESGEGEE